MAEQFYASAQGKTTHLYLWSSSPYRPDKRQVSHMSEHKPEDVFIERQQFLLALNEYGNFLIRIRDRARRSIRRSSASETKAASNYYTTAESVTIFNLPLAPINSRVIWHGRRILKILSDWKLNSRPQSEDDSEMGDAIDDLLDRCEGIETERDPFDLELIGNAMSEAEHVQMVAGWKRNGLWGVEALKKAFDTNAGAT